jgi:hypothetical protein
LVGVGEMRRRALQRTNLPVPQRVRVPVQIDTGTTYSALAPAVFRQLEIGDLPVDTVRVLVPGAQEAPCEFKQYVVSLSLDQEGIEMLIPSVEVLESNFGAEEGIQGMLGRDVLGHCLFVYDGQANTFSLAF